MDPHIVASDPSLVLRPNSNARQPKSNKVAPAELQQPHRIDVRPAGASRPKRLPQPPIRVESEPQTGLLRMIDLFFLSCCWPRIDSSNPQFLGGAQKGFWMYFDRAFTWWENSNGKKLVIAVGRGFLASDLITDSMVAKGIYDTEHDRRLWLFFIAVGFIFLQYVVMWAILFRPIRKLFLEDKVARGWCAKVKRKEWHFNILWLVFGIPSLIGMDLFICTYRMFSELEDTTYIIYYERLRLLCECVLEAMPESFFQLAIWRAGIVDQIDQDLLYISIGISFMSFFKCMYATHTHTHTRTVLILYSYSYSYSYCTHTVLILVLHSYYIRTTLSTHHTI
jgi:hypothetical protein